MIHQLIFLSTEIDILDLRLHELSNIIDKFIVVEYPFNYSGNPCTMYYNESGDRFKDFKHKIIHVIDDNTYGGLRGMALLSARQNSQVLMQVLAKFEQTDFLSVCDGDAFIRKEAFENLDTTKHTSFLLEWCQYWINAYCPDVSFPWSFGLPISLCMSLGGINKAAHTSTGDIRHVPNAGWHWSKMGGVDKVIENIRGYPHQEYANNPILVNPALVKEKIENMWGWDDPHKNSNPNNWKYYFRKFDPSFYPAYIGQNLDIFSKYIKDIE